MRARFLSSDLTKAASARWRNCNDEQGLCPAHYYFIEERAYAIAKAIACARGQPRAKNSSLVASRRVPLGVCIFRYERRRQLPPERRAVGGTFVDKGCTFDGLRGLNDAYADI